MTKRPLMSRMEYTKLKQNIHYERLRNLEALEIVWKASNPTPHKEE